MTASGKKFDLGSVVISQYKPSNGWEVSQFFSGRDGVIQYFTFEDKVFFLQKSSKNLYQFDGNKWTKMKDVPIELFNQEVTFTANGKGYLMACITKTVGVYSRAMWEYDPLSDKWIEIANFPGAARNNGIGFSVGSKAYYGLGVNESNQNLTDFWEFDGSSKKWSKKNNAPFSGYVSLSPYTYLDGKIFTYFADLLYEYNTQNDTWKKKTGSIKAQTPYILVTSNNLIYAIAKEYFVNENAPLKLYYYDIRNDNYVFIKDFAGAQRYGIQGFVINNKLFAGLGYDGRLNTPRLYKDVWSLKL